MGIEEAPVKKIAVNSCLLGTKSLPASAHCYADLFDDVSTIDSSFFFCSLRETATLKKMGLECFAFADIRVSEFLPALGDLCLNFRDSYYKQVCQLDTSDIGKFCRSDSGAKLWSGQVLDDRMLVSIRDLMQPDDMLFFSEPREVLSERRFWVKDEELVAWSCYLDVDSEVDEGAKEFARYVASLWTPDDVCVLDVCTSGGERKVVEFNAWSCSGFYGADVSKIIDATWDYRRCK